MSKEERQSLLHEGVGASTISAYVEIVFDNSDGRFPTGKDEVVLRRTIGLKKDEYSLDKKSVRKGDVINLLESAGFSRSNPYYIVPQGRVTALTNAKDHERLALLREVAGTRVYEERRLESLKIMEETDQKRTRIIELLEYIEERLAELEEEKQELKKFQEADRKRRCLEYTIYSKEQDEVNEQLEDLEIARQSELEGAQDRQNRYVETERMIAETEREINSLKSKREAVSGERAQLEEELGDKMRSKAALELLIGDLSEGAKQTLEQRARLEQELRKYDGQIASKQRDLDAILPDFITVQIKETDLKTTKEKLDLEKTALYAKQTRHSRFLSQGERNNWLNTEISKFQTLVAETTRSASAIRTEISTGKEKVALNAKQRGDKETRVATMREEMSDMEKRERQVREERMTFDEKRKTLWRDEAKSSQAASSIKDQLNSARRAFDGMMDRHTVSGLQAVRRIADRLGLSEKVYGPLYELFEVDERFQTAVEVICGGSLFHVVVEDDATVTRILDVMNKERAGRVTFMPLNRLKPREGVDQDSLGKGVIPMLRKLKYDEHLHKAFVQVFGRAVICQNLDVADRCARSHNLNAVTIDGDRVGKKGEITGGFHDKRRSRLEAARTVQRLEAEFEQESRAVREIQQEIHQIDQAITKSRDEQTKIDRLRVERQDTYEQLNREIHTIIKEEARLEETIMQKEKSLETLQLDLKNDQTQLDSYKNELKTPFSQSLSKAELARLEVITKELAGLESSLQEASVKRVELDEKIKILNLTLNQNLKRRRNDAAAKLDDISLTSSDGSNPELDSRRNELTLLQRQLNEVSKRIEDIDGQGDEMNTSIREKNQACDKARNELQEDHRVLQLQARHTEKYLSKKALLTKKKDETIQSIRELGVLPDEAFEKYKELNTKQLVSKLHKVNEGLKKFGHVNKKAVEQYNNFTTQRENLENRRGELDDSKKAIEDLIKVLDQRKNEAIQRMFKQVAKNFAEVWEKLVPAGAGQLIMLVKNDASEEGVEEDTEDAETAAKKKDEMDRYSGVSIKVSFNNKVDEGMRMSQLSGGQKSLVALALIFAIQRCDPAPFYLFDEIDAALDAQYRTAVANMIHELSDTAQFITTTFRPEMLVNASKFYGVTFTNKVSKIQVIDKEAAKAFVEQEQPQ